MSTNPTRKVAHVTKTHAGAHPDEGVSSEVSVMVQVRYLPHGENELIAHYLINQASREILARVDEEGLTRVADQAGVLA